MKKVLFVLVLMMSVLVINAQATKTSTTTKPVKTTINVADLQKPITDNIVKDYAGYTIKGATSVTASNTVTYNVVVVKGTATETLVYDKDGKFIKKQPHTTSKHHSTK